MSDESYSFTTARARLEEIVTQVRKKDTSLEASLDLLEEGVRLANACTELIDRADWTVGEVGEGVEGVESSHESMEATGSDEELAATTRSDEEPAEVTEDGVAAALAAPEDPSDGPDHTSEYREDEA